MPSQPAAADGGAGGRPDLAGALRVLMRHGRLADAASLAAQHLQHALHSVPSVGMARTSQVRPVGWGACLLHVRAAHGARLIVCLHA